MLCPGHPEAHPWGCRLAPGDTSSMGAAGARLKVNVALQTGFSPASQSFRTVLVRHLSCLAELPNSSRAAARHVEFYFYCLELFRVYFELRKSFFLVVSGAFPPVSGASTESPDHENSNKHKGNSKQTRFGDFWSGSEKNSICRRKQTRFTESSSTKKLKKNSHTSGGQERSISQKGSKLVLQREE